MVGIYDHLTTTLGQPTPPPPPAREPREGWSRNEKMAALGLALSAASIAIGAYEIQQIRRTTR